MSTWCFVTLGGSSDLLSLRREPLDLVKLDRRGMSLLTRQSCSEAKASIPDRTTDSAFLNDRLEIGSVRAYKVGYSFLTVSLGH